MAQSRSCPAPAIPGPAASLPSWISIAFMSQCSAMSPRAPGALLAGALLLLAGCALAWPSAEDQSPAAQLARWVVRQGGELNGIKVRKACVECPRGVFATRDFAEGDVIARVPFKAMLKLPGALDGAPLFPAEFARDLLLAMHRQPGWNDTWGPYWATLPGPDEVFSPEVFTDDEISMLHSGQLEALVRNQRDITVQVYFGNYTQFLYTSFDNEIPPEKVGLDTFKYVSSLICTRKAGFEVDGKTTFFLPPILDLMNHADENNCFWTNDGSHAVVKAARPIKKGQEITSNYQPGIIHRPDMSLLLYGFVIPRQDLFLAATDLPDYNPQQPFAQTAVKENLYDGEVGSGHVTEKELQRIWALMREAPTSPKEDQAMLDSGTARGWRERTILQFRVQRKRALERAVDRLVAALKGQGGPASADAKAEL